MQIPHREFAEFLTANPPTSSPRIRRLPHHEFPTANSPTYLYRWRISISKFAENPWRMFAQSFVLLANIIHREFGELNSCEFVANIHHVSFKWTVLYTVLAAQGSNYIHGPHSTRVKLYTRSTQHKGQTIYTVFAAQGSNYIHGPRSTKGYQWASMPCKLYTPRSTRVTSEPQCHVNYIHGPRSTRVTSEPQCHVNYIHGPRSTRVTSEPQCHVNYIHGPRSTRVTSGPQCHVNYIHGPRSTRVKLYTRS